MTPHYPKATQIPFLGASGGTYVSAGPFRGVLHTTQSKDYKPSPTNYYGHKNPPHFTLHKKGKVVSVYQHYSINVSSRALKNINKAKNDIQTNRLCAIQIEICWYAEDIKNLPKDMQDELRLLMRWIENESGIKKVAPTFYGDDAYGEGGIARMTTKKWLDFNGWCGHQHVPENDHWDPGKIDIAYLLT